jgi:RecA-family ATPase
MRVIPSLLRRAEHPNDVVDRVVDVTMEMSEREGLGWIRSNEIKKARERCFSAIKNLLLSDYDPDAGTIPNWLCGEWQKHWSDLLIAGRTPEISCNAFGFYVRAKNRKEAPGEEPRGEAGFRSIFVLRPFVPRDEASLPPRVFLYGRHYQRGTVGTTVAPGGTGKTSLNMCEGVAMATGRNLLGEQPEERLRVWFHNGEDNMDELNRRLVAICKHYQIPQEDLVGWFFMTTGDEVPLKVARGHADLKIEGPLIRCISAEIERNEIDVAILDPLVTLHDVSEQDNSKMDTVVRIFSGIASERDCHVELAQHTRKLSHGAEEFRGDDARGASAVRDAVRAQRVLNQMSTRDAGEFSIDDAERGLYFRIDKTKGNNSPPGKAVWRKFVNVVLLNGDEVGVVEAWDCPGSGAPSEAMEKANRAAEELFLTLLARLTLQGRAVNDTSGPRYAPSVFANEPEAKKAKISKKALVEAMRRLFAANRITMQEVGSGGHKVRSIASC